MAKGYSLHIGINEVNPIFYKGKRGRINCCERDAEAMAKIALAVGFKEENINYLLTKDATVVEFNQAVLSLSKKAKAGDLVFISFSGHGKQVKDLDGDEKALDPTDEYDESWCLYNGQVIDDRIFGLFKRFEKGVRILVVSDSCYSGTIIRDDELLSGTIKDKMKSKASKLLNSELKASVKLLASSQEDEKSKAGVPNSKFTQYLLDVWADGTFTGNYEEFHAKINYKFLNGQNPAIWNRGPSNPDFDNSRPFQI